MQVLFYVKTGGKRSQISARYPKIFSIMCLSLAYSLGERGSFQILNNLPLLFFGIAVIMILISCRESLVHKNNKILCHAHLLSSN